MGYQGETFTLTLALSHRGRGDLIGVLCFSLGSRLCGNDGGPAPFTLTPALSHRGRGGLIGVLCFSLGSRLCGNDGVCAEMTGDLRLSPSPQPSPIEGEGV